MKFDHLQKIFFIWNENTKCNYFVPMAVILRNVTLYTFTQIKILSMNLDLTVSLKTMRQAASHRTTKETFFFRQA